MFEDGGMALVTALIETFEEFLDARGIDVPNEEKEEDDWASTIYGTDFGDLQSMVADTLAAYGIECPAI